MNTRRLGVTLMMCGTVLGTTTPLLKPVLASEVTTTKETKTTSHGKVYTDKAEYDKAFARYQQQLKEYQDKLSAYNSSYATITKENDQINANNKQKYADYQTAYSKYQAELKAYDTVYADYTAKLKEAQQQADDNQHKLADYQDKMDAYEQAVDDFNKAISDYNDAVQKVVDSNNKADQKYADDLASYEADYKDYQQKVDDYKNALADKQLTDEQNAKLLAEYLQALSDYHDKMGQYADDLTSYNTSVEEANKVIERNQAKEDAYQKEQDEYQDELAKYNTAMDDYNQRLATWQANKDAGKYEAFDTAEAVKNIYHYFNEYSDTVKMVQDGLTTYGSGRQETNRAYQEANNPLDSNAKLKDLLTSISTEDQKMGDHFKQLDSKLSWNSPTVASIGTSEAVGSASEHSTGSFNWFENAPLLPQELSKPADPAIVDKYLDELLADTGSFDASQAFASQYNQIVTKADADKYREALKLSVEQSEPQFERALTTLLTSYQTYNSSAKTKVYMDKFIQDYQTFNDETNQAYLSVRGSEWPLLGDGSMYGDYGAFLTGLKNKSAQELASDYGYLTLFMNMDYLVVQGMFHKTNSLSIHNSASDDTDYHQKSLTVVDHSEDAKPTDVPTKPTAPTPPTLEDVPAVPSEPTKPAMPDAPKYAPEVTIPELPSMPTIPTPPTHTELPDKPTLTEPTLPDAPELTDVVYPEAPMVPHAPEQPTYDKLHAYPKAPVEPVAPIYKGTIAKPTTPTKPSKPSNKGNTVSNGSIKTNGNVIKGTTAKQPTSNKLTTTPQATGVSKADNKKVNQKKNDLPTTGTDVKAGLMGTIMAGLVSLWGLMTYRKRQYK